MSQVLQNERQNATFNVKELIDLLNGGVKATHRRKQLESLIYDNPNIDLPYQFQSSREENYVRGIKLATELIKTCKKHNIPITLENPDYNLLIRSFPDFLTVCLHVDMFEPSIAVQGTEEQKNKWIPLARDFKILGSYAQTELGHGSFVRGLETTATYDPAHQQFILNSPTLTSTKWWPGFTAQTCNCAVVVAQLYVKDKCYGVHLFIVQLRSLKDHKPLPGITLGDIGNKFGYDTIDNGFLRFDNVRIPRENMLMKYAKVTPQGTYIPPITSKTAYSTLTVARFILVKDSSKYLAAASTIAIRYSAVRHQTEITPGKEPQILDYATQQLKLLPQLATAHAFHFVGKYMMDTYNKVHAAMSSGQLDSLSELHGTSAGLKAYVTDATVAGIEVCRRACGGHGYSNASGIQHLYGRTLPNVTLDGENTVLYLQAARYLIKSFHNPKNASDMLNYLRKSPKREVWKVDSLQDLSNNDLLISAFEQRALSKITNAVRKLEEHSNNGKDKYEAWNCAGMELIQAAKAHYHYFIVKCYLQLLDKVVMSPSLSKVMKSVALLYANYGIDENYGDLLEIGFMNEKHAHLVRMKILHLLREIRPNAVAIVDSFDINDKYLSSVLGAYDGDVYNRLYQWAKLSPLNKTEVHSSYTKYLQHLLKSSL